MSSTLRVGHCHHFSHNDLFFLTLILFTIINHASMHTYTQTKHRHADSKFPSCVNTAAAEHGWLVQSSKNTMRPHGARNIGLLWGCWGPSSHDGIDILCDTGVGNSRNGLDSLSAIRRLQRGGVDEGTLGIDMARCKQ